MVSNSQAAKQCVCISADFAVLIQIQNLRSMVLSSLMLIKPNSSESFLAISSHTFHTSVTSKKSVWRRWTFCVLLLTLPGEPISTRCYTFIDRLFVLSSTMAVLSMVPRENLTYIGSDTEPRTAAMPRCLQNLTCLKYLYSSQWTSTLHTSKNSEHTVFPQTWLIPEQSSLQYGLQPKLQSFLFFKT